MCTAHNEFDMVETEFALLKVKETEVRRRKVGIRAKGELLAPEKVAPQQELTIFFMVQASVGAAVIPAACAEIGATQDTLLRVQPQQFLEALVVMVQALSAQGTGAEQVAGVAAEPVAHVSVAGETVLL